MLDIMGVFLFVFGLLIGSFLNVCIYRIPQKESVAVGRSHCPKCNTPLRFYELVPVLSFLALRGKCRTCKVPISVQYPLVELLMGLLYFALYLRFDLSWQFAGFAVLATLLVVIAGIDLWTMEIPNGLVLAIAVLAVPFCIFDRALPWYEHLIGFVAASGWMLILALLYDGGMGGGDIKLMAACGGILGWKWILASLVSGAVLAMLCMLPLMFFGKTRLKTAVPFGPFLAAGVLCCVLLAPEYGLLFKSLLPMF